MALGLLSSSLSGSDGAGWVYCNARHPCPGAPAILCCPRLRAIRFPLWPQWYGPLQQGVEGCLDKTSAEAERTLCSLKLCMCVSFSSGLQGAAVLINDSNACLIHWNRSWLKNTDDNYMRMVTKKKIGGKKEKKIIPLHVIYSFQSDCRFRKEMCVS